jgi:uncharacterized OsmC-like protein
MYLTAIERIKVDNGLSMRDSLGRSLDRITRQLRCTPRSTQVTQRERSGDGQQIADALKRLNGRLARRPDFGHHTGSSVTTLVEGLRCSTEAGEWTIASDLRPAFGGEGSAPTPTVLLSSALGACLAMGYQLRAAEYGIELTSVRVTVETDSELGGMLRCDAAVPPGFTEVRYRVELESPAGTSDLERIVDLADRLSPVLDALTRVNRVQRTVSINERVA